MSQDIVLITIDALRHDVTSRMEAVRTHFSADETGEAITSGAATNWVFPGILSGTYYPAAYGEDGLPKDELRTLPDVLGDAGYETGAFLGFNPYLSKWGDRFDTFWNGGIANADEEWYSNQLEKWASRFYRTALLKKRVPGPEVVQRASDWYHDHDQSSPRFLWIHLMEPHGPYYPGLSAARDVGLFDAYRSIINFQRFGDDAPQRDLDVQRDLYERCVDRADDRVDDIMGFVDSDATVVVVADHGEEFEHGHIDHERLYDECVRVPYFHRNLGDRSVPESVRQIDIPAEILGSVGVSVPDGWDAESFETDTPALMLTPWEANGTFQYAIRTATAKLIRTYDIDSGAIIETEYYDLDSDPNEQADIYGTVETDTLETQLDEFVEAHEHAVEINPETGIDSSVVDDRLRNLGYK